jgi:hypothetical protein
VGILRVGLQAGSYVALIEGQPYGNGTIIVWRQAAADAARKIQRWIKDNHDKLIAKRVQK